MAATPTVLQLQLGKELKRLREARGWTLAEAVEVLGNRATKLSRLENGLSSVRPLDIRVLCEALGATREETAWAVETARFCNQRSRWSGYRSTYNKSYRMAVDLEQDASIVNHYQSEIVPGLLQTEDYMRVVFESDPLSRDKVDEGVKARLERQQVLTKSNAPQFEFVLSESALVRMVGDEVIMRAQLRHIARVADLSNVHLRVLPFRTRSYPPASICPFAIFTIPSHGSAVPLQCVYVEDYDHGRYRDDHDSIDTYNDMWRRFVGASLELVESREMVLRLAGSY